VDIDSNPYVEVADIVNDIPISTNGVPMTDDFDLAVYVKGDRKATGVFDATLSVDWDSVTPVLAIVPDVVGLPQADAEADIIAASLVVGNVTMVSSDTVPAGDVISQDPLSGTSVAWGSAVDLVVSLGPVVVPVDVPNVIGMTETDAGTTLVNAGLAVGTVTYVTDEAPAGEVIDQLPLACEDCATAGDAVALTVSTGPVGDLSDVSISSIFVPSSVPKSVSRKFDVYIINDINAAGDGSGFVRIIGTEGTNVDLPFTDLPPSTVATLLSTTWTSPSTSTVIDWTVELWVDGSLIETVYASTRVR
jgi:hypothetical protein